MGKGKSFHLSWLVPQACWCSRCVLSMPWETSCNFGQPWSGSTSPGGQIGFQGLPRAAAHWAFQKAWLGHTNFRRISMVFCWFSHAIFQPGACPSCPEPRTPSVGWEEGGFFSVLNDRAAPSPCQFGALGQRICWLCQPGCNCASTQFGKQRFFFLRDFIANVGCDNTGLHFPNPPGSEFVLQQSQEWCYKNVYR